MKLVTRRRVLQCCSELSSKLPDQYTGTSTQKFRTQSSGSIMSLFSCLWLTAFLVGSFDDFNGALAEASSGGVLQPALYAVNDFRQKKRLTQIPVNKVIKGLAGLRPYICLEHCIRMRSKCAAFNLDTTNGICELLSAHVCNHSGIELDQSETFSYYDIYEDSAAERGGIMYSTPYCTLKGFCNPDCEPWAYMPRLNEACGEDYECQMRIGPRSVCRKPPDICKCQTGYYINDNPETGQMECLKMDAEGFDIFPNLKSESKKGLYFKLVMMDMTFEQASNHCITVEGGYLAFAEDGETNRYLREYMRKNKVRAAWLGLSDQAQEGNWIWSSTGQKLKTAQFWKSGAPDNFNDIEHCAMITNEIDFGWDDVPCEKTGKFFCQRDETN